MIAFRARPALALPVMLALGLTSSARAVDVAGTQVTVGWTPASGPVSGYYVIVARDAEPAQVESVTIDAKKTLSGDLGQTLVVQVAAFTQDGVASGSGDTAPPPPSGGETTPPPGGADPVPTEPGGIGVARDFDGDGIADLVVASGSSVRIWVLGAGQVAAELSLPAAPQGSRVVGTGDYDGNRTADLLWENTQTGALTLWTLDRGAIAGTRLLDRSSLPAGEEWHVGGSADFDGDGADDLMLFSRVKGEVEIWTLTATSVASRTRLPGHKGAWSVAAVDDTDGDGKAEIVWLDELDRSLELHDPAAAAPVALGTLTQGWRGRGGADLLGDGSAELLILDPATGAMQDWALDDAGILGSADLPNASTLGQFAGSGDFDGDGAEDIAWGNSSAGAVTLWLSPASQPRSVALNRALPAGGQIVSGATASDDSAFRRRFCSGDLDGNGTVNTYDFKLLRSCLKKSRTAACDLADMDSDGVVTAADTEIWNLRFTGERCGAW
jgi:hypothetical protein